jgi:hypothetical protein
MTVRDEDLDRLWAKNKIAVHFPGVGDEDSTSLNPDDYAYESERNAIGRLVELAENGGYVWAESRSQAEAKIGVVPPNTEVQLYSATYTEQHDPRYKDREGAEAILKTLQLDRVKEIAPYEAASLWAARPRRGTIMRWRACGAELEALVEGRSVEREWEDFSPNRSVDRIGAQERHLGVRRELEHRKNLWGALLDAGGPKGVVPKVLRDLGIYGGAQGVWVDKARTASLTEDATGVTVGLLHTGSSYADDLSDDGVLYHYPATNRPRGRDLAEIEATKAARRLGLPVFVITYPSPGSARRDVHLGWVERWDDSLETFLITFGDSQPSPRLTDAEEQPFRLVEERRTAVRQVEARVGQQRFKFLVFQRYGERCAVCGISAPRLLDAAHLRPKRERGTDDPRNGLVLCVSHHRALDAGLFAIEPGSLRIRCKASGPDARALRIDHSTLEQLPNKPHGEAIGWLWSRWQG